MNKTKRNVSIIFKTICIFFILMTISISAGCKINSDKKDQKSKENNTDIDNKQIAKDVIEKLFNQKNAEVIDDLFNTNYIFHHPFFKISGIEGVKQQLSISKVFSDFHMNEEEILSDKDLVVSRFTVYGKHIGEFMGIPATGKSLQFTGIIISRIENGKISEEWEFADLIGVHQQLGSLTSIAGNIIPIRKSPDEFAWGKPLATKTNPENPQKNKNMVRSIVKDLFNNSSKQTFSDYFSDNFIFHAPSIPDLKTKQDFKRYWKRINQATQSTSITIDDIVAERDMVAIRWTSNSILSYTEKVANTQGIVIFKTADGKIEEGWLSINLIGLLQQLDALPLSPN